jgi:hypothetical protein
MIQFVVQFLMDRVRTKKGSAERRSQRKNQSFHWHSPAEFQ